ELAKRGYNRDGRRGKLQIVYGLLCAADGCPVAVEVFEGNTGDPKTLAAQIGKLKQRFKLDRVVLVSDRGMITDARIREELQPAGLDWITALRAPAIQALAAERTRKRRELLDTTEKDLARIEAAVDRKRGPLRGKDQIGIAVGTVIGKHKMAKHFELAIEDASFTFRRKEAEIAAEAMLDGLYVIRTSLPKEAIEAEDAVNAYKSLSQVERAFRSLKTVDLEIRPIHHWLSDRVRAHVFLCM